MSSFSLSTAKWLLTKQTNLTKVIFTSAIFLISSGAVSGTICELPWNWNLQECKSLRGREAAKRNINFDSETRINEHSRMEKELKEKQEQRKKEAAFQAQQAAEQARVQQQIANQGCIFSRIINSQKDIFTVVANDHVSFRSSPEYRNDNVYMAIPQGRQVAITHKLPVCSFGQLFFRANYNGQTGWISEGTVEYGYFLN